MIGDELTFDFDFVALGLYLSGMLLVDATPWAGMLETGASAFTEAGSCCAQRALEK